MANSKVAKTKLSPAEFHHKITAATTIRLPMENVVNEELAKLICGVAKSSGVKNEMVVLPILTVVSGLMGKSTAATHLDISFEEPNVLWTITAAEPGSRKSQALKSIVKALKLVDAEVNEDANVSISGNSSQDYSRRLFALNETISMAKLQEEFRINDGCYLGLYDEIEGLLESVESSTRPDSKDEDTWLMLHGGTVTGRNTTKGRGTVMDSRMCYAGFIQPELIISRLITSDNDGFMARHLIIVVEREETMLEDIGPPKTEELRELFLKVFKQHENVAGGVQGLRYKICQEGGKLFLSYNNGLERELTRQLERGANGYLDRKLTSGMIAKSSGNVVRLAMVFQALQNASEDHQERTEEGIILIAEQSVKSAITLVDYINEVRMAMLSTNKKPSTPVKIQSVDQGLFGKMTKANFLEQCQEGLQKFLEVAGEQNSTSVVQFRRFCLSKGDKTDAAKSFMSKVASVGFGDVFKGKTKSITFRKRPYSDLDESLQDYITQKNVKYGNTD